jgi:uncharacterized protein (TIGR03435 family)
MDTFEDTLREALREPQPPADLTENVMTRIPRPYRGRYRALIPVAAILALAVASFAVLRTTTSGASAVVESADGQDLQPGQKIPFDKIVHTNAAAGTVLALRDGSRIEMRPLSGLALEHAADGVRIRLDAGAVIVNAAKQPGGHLYVQTKDVIVAVVGTVFLVSAEETGSRVAVIQGEVRVQQGATSKALSPGEQVATNPLMESLPVREEIAWSRNAPAHLALLPQPPAPPRFEVVSLKPVPPGATANAVDRLFRCKAIDGLVHATTGDILNLSVLTNALAALPPAAAPPLGRCIGQVHPRQLVAQAYKVQPRYITNDATWPDIYQIEAKVENPATVTTEQIREMLQSLLTDRYAFKMHRETREGAGCVLRVGRSGPKFAEAPGEEEFGSVPAAPGPITFKAKLRMKSFADSLAMLAAGPVIDRTGLTAVYDLTLRVGGGGAGAGAGDGAGGGRGGGPGSRTVCSGDLRDALNDQLGLVLEPAKVPVDYIVVDHIEKPSEN